METSRSELFSSHDPKWFERKSCPWQRGAVFPPELPRTAFTTLLRKFWKNICASLLTEYSTSAACLCFGGLVRFCAFWKWIELSFGIKCLFFPLVVFSVKAFIFYEYGSIWRLRDFQHSKQLNKMPEHTIRHAYVLQESGSGSSNWQSSILNVIF